MSTRARFAVGTGRCGSTLLSKMLDRHVAVVSLHEFFTGLDWGRRFGAVPVDGAHVADLVATPNRVIDLVVGRGYEAEEVTYPFRPTDRYRRGEPIPWILTSTLGYLDDDPDALFDRTVRWLRSRTDVVPIAEHYRALFDHLAAGAGASEWIERSGSSLDYVGDLAALFPDARFVHIHRDGREVALSMRNHPFYRLAVQLLFGLMPDDVDPADEDAVVDAWLSRTPPLGLFGRYWSDQMTNGLDALACLDPARVMTVSFEEMVRDPVPALERMARFYELPVDDGFAPRGAALVRNVAPLRFPELADRERAELEESCAPGFAALGDRT